MPGPTVCRKRCSRHPVADPEAEAATPRAAPVHACAAHWAARRSARPAPQEIPQPELQPLALEAKAAAALLKYVPLPARLLPGAIGHLAAGAAAGLWAARAAALVFAQYLWFRHTLLLAPGQAAGLRGLAEAALSDRKLEVGELAAGTLSGMLKARRRRPYPGARGPGTPPPPASPRPRVPSVPSVTGALASACWVSAQPTLDLFRLDALRRRRLPPHGAGRAGGGGGGAAQALCRPRGRALPGRPPAPAQQRGWRIWCARGPRSALPRKGRSSGCGASAHPASWRACCCCCMRAPSQPPAHGGWW